MPCMQDVHDLHAVREHAMYDDIIGMRDQFACSGNSARPIEVWMFGKGQYDAFYAVLHSFRGCWVKICDLSDQLLKVIKG